VSFKNRIKSLLKRLRVFYEHAFYSFSATEFEQALRDLSITSGDTILVHSSFDAFKGFQGKPTDIIATLQKAVSPTGIIIMPTMPFTGTAVDYARANPLFDAKRTPSRMGLITELFRRSSGVIRSLHPTHPVAVWGNQAEAIAAQHYLARTPCGQGSPFERLLEHQGKILLIGTGIGVLTFYHYIEELFEERLPINPFTKELFLLKVKDPEGNLHSCETRLFEPAVSRRRNLHKIVPELKRIEALHRRRIGKLDITVLRAQDVLNATRNLLDRGIHCYD